jgi:ABC-2 type transport system ATP-binding protein
LCGGDKHHCTPWLFVRRPALSFLLPFLVRKSDMSSALSIRQLTKTYGNGFQALSGIDLDVAEGDFFALLGPNGAGKSTTSAFSRPW